jgi:hypothetical protein
MQALHSPFPYLFPSPLLFENCVYFLEAADRVDRTECHKPDLEIGKIATLSDGDEVRSIEFSRCSIRRVKIARENRHLASGKVVTLRQNRFVHTGPEMYHSERFSSGYGRGGTCLPATHATCTAPTRSRGTDVYVGGSRSAAPSSSTGARVPLASAGEGRCAAIQLAGVTPLASAACCKADQTLPGKSTA